MILYTGNTGTYTPIILWKICNNLLLCPSLFPFPHSYFYTVARLLSDPAAYVLSYTYDITNASIRIFYPHINNTAVIFFSVKRGVHFYPSPSKLFPDIIRKNDISTACFVCRIKQGFIFIDFLIHYLTSKHSSFAANLINRFQCPLKTLYAESAIFSCTKPEQDFSYCYATSVHLLPDLSLPEFVYHQKGLPKARKIRHYHLYKAPAVPRIP